MNLIHRYLFREVLIASLMSVALFVFILLAGNALRDIAGLVASGQLSFPVFLRLMALLIPYVVAYALPLGLLTGIMVALGKLSSNRELTAMRTTGLSLFYLSAPIVLIALLGVALSLAFNFYYTPVARTQYKEILARVVRDNPLNFLQPRTFIKAFPGYVVYIGQRDGNTLRDFWIWELDDEDRVRLFVRAESGYVDYDAAEAAIILTLVNGTGERRRPDDPEDFSDPHMMTLFFRELPIRLSLDRILGRTTVRRKLNMLNAHQLFAEWNRVRRLPVAGVDEAGPAIDRVRIQMQIQRNLAMGFSVFSMCLVAIPLAIRIGRKETYANFALALGLALSFYFLMVVVSWLESRPALRPDLLIWLPNLAKR